MVSLRKISRIILGSLFTVCLGATIITYMLVSLTSLKFVKTLIPTISKDMLNESSLSNSYSYLNRYCSFYSNSTINFTIPQLLINVSIPCSEMRNVSSKNFGEFIFDKSVEKIYFRSISCRDLIECLKDPQNMLSYKFNKMVSKTMFYLIFLTFFFGILYFYSIESWSERFRNMGVILFLLQHHIL